MIVHPTHWGDQEFIHATCGKIHQKKSFSLLDDHINMLFGDISSQSWERKQAKNQNVSASVQN
jgi:hypothetical protein